MVAVMSVTAATNEAVLTLTLDGFQVSESILHRLAHNLDTPERVADYFDYSWPVWTSDTPRTGVYETQTRVEELYRYAKQIALAACAPEEKVAA